MDKKQILGILLIAAILIVTSILTRPSKEELEAARQKQLQNDTAKKSVKDKDTLDITQVNAKQNQESNQKNIISADSLNNDSNFVKQYGPFYKSSKGENKFIILENDKIKLTISTKGGRPYSVQVKNYMRYDSLPVVLFNGDENNFGLDLKYTVDYKNISITTNNLFFTPMSNDSVVVAEKSAKSLTLRLVGDNNTYIEYKYSIEPGQYLVDFDMNFVGLNQIIPKTISSFDMNWSMKALRIEKGKDWENQYTSIFYKLVGGSVENLSETSAKDVVTKPWIKWIDFKQQFFSTIFFAKDSILSGTLSQNKITDDPNLLKAFNAKLSIQYKGKDNEKASFAFYFGPNQYKILNKIKFKKDDNFELIKIIPLGWGWGGMLAWINRFAIIPIFNWLGGFISNFGIVILLLTIILKLVLFPLTYKSYVSSAKMRVLKPQIDEINAKIPKEKAMERQQATMALYRKVGVNPMGGCLPMLLQFPILIAMYRFFPASIELRQKAFLWATDLSSYDSIWNLPFNIPMYGDHVSLFTLLMAVSMIFSTKISSNQMQGANAQMPGMKMMMYMMPVMMLLWFNKYSSGLSYYYFLTNIITIGQTLIIRRFVDDEAVLRKISENKKKPTTKSKFQQRLEDMAKQRSQQKPRGKK